MRKIAIELINRKIDFDYTVTEEMEEIFHSVFQVYILDNRLCFDTSEESTCFPLTDESYNDVIKLILNKIKINEKRTD